MKRPRLRTLLLVPLVLLGLLYTAAAVRVATFDDSPPPPPKVRVVAESIAIFGGSGTAGDGILKAALADPQIESILIVTRRTTPRMEQGVSDGRVQILTHVDYLDYSEIIDRFSGVEAVFWALGTSSIGMDEGPYREIHVDFPVRFVEQWLEYGPSLPASFHYISSSDISADSSAMWARVKVEAENALFALAEEEPLRVIAYRPDYIGPTAEEAHLGQRLAYGIFAPVGAAVKALQIGQAMIEVVGRGDEFESGSKLSTWRIRRYSDAYERQVATAN